MQCGFSEMIDERAALKVHKLRELFRRSKINAYGKVNQRKVVHVGYFHLLILLAGESNIYTGFQIRFNLFFFRFRIMRK